MKTLVMLSGGLDSAVMAYDACAGASGDGDVVSGVFFDYGQTNYRQELVSAERISTRLDIRLNVIKIPDVMRGGIVGGNTDVSSAYIPGRNMIFLSLAGAMAVARGYDRVGFATHDGYGASVSDVRLLDCAPWFCKVVEYTWLYTLGGLKLWTPYLYEKRDFIWREAVRLKVPTSLTWTCWTPVAINGSKYGERGVKPCGVCAACKDRQMGKELANA